MPKLFSSDQSIYHIILSVLLGLASTVAIAQTKPAPPATIDPSAPTSETISSSTSSVAASSAPAKPPEKPIYASPSERDNTLLAKAQPEEALWLETPNEKIIVRYKQGETRKTKGSLLILHAPELPQLWPAPLESIRRNLPLYGWETMTVPLPQKYPNQTPERDAPPPPPASASSAASLSAGEATSDSSASAAEASSVAASSADTSSVAASSAQASSAPAEPPKPLFPREQLISERIDAAVAELNKNGQLNIIVLVDNSSAVDSLSALYKKINPDSSGKKKIDGPVQALILVNLQEQEPLNKEQLEIIFSVPMVPVMDVFFAVDDQYQVDLRRLHRAAAMRRNIRNYQQLVLPPETLMTTKDTQGFWLEKVRGFMETKAQGTELKLNQ